MTNTPVVRRGRPPKVPRLETVMIEPKVEPEVTPQVLPLTPIEAFIERMAKLKADLDDKPYQ